MVCLGNELFSKYLISSEIIILVIRNKINFPATFNWKWKYNWLT